MNLIKPPIWDRPADKHTANNKKKKRKQRKTETTKVRVLNLETCRLGPTKNHKHNDNVYFLLSILHTHFPFIHSLSIVFLFSFVLMCDFMTFAVIMTRINALRGRVVRLFFLFFFCWQIKKMNIVVYIFYYYFLFILYFFLSF